MGQTPTQTSLPQQASDTVIEANVASVGILPW